MSSASAAAKTLAVLRRYGTGVILSVIPTPSSKCVPVSREPRLDELTACRRDACVRQIVSKS